MHNPPLVLLVDDDATIHDLFSIILTNAGFSVAQAWNGKEGIETAKKDVPDLILLDVMMPIMDGNQTLLAIRSDEALKDVPVIILTSLHGGPEDIKFAEDSGATAFVSKAADPREIVTKIKTALHMP